MPLITPTRLTDWRMEFAANIRCDPTSQKTWQEIENSGIACEAAWLLHWYANGQPVVKEFSRRNRRAVTALRAARRAISKAEEKRCDPREAMFVKRRREQIVLAGNTPWINPYSPCQTLADAAAVYPIGNLALDQLPEVMAKKGEMVRRSGTMELLLILQLYAGKHGVRLGLKRLVALTGCANVNRLRAKYKPWQEDEKNLSRFFNRPDVKRAALLHLADFERHLPGIRLKLKQFFTVAPLTRPSV